MSTPVCWLSVNGVPEIVTVDPSAAQNPLSALPETIPPVTDAVGTATSSRPLSPLPVTVVSSTDTMLAAAANLIASSDNSDAVTQLQEAYLRTDGNTQPPDFVMGQATDALAGRILELIHLLGG